MCECVESCAGCEHRLPLLEAALAEVREAVYLLDDLGRPHYVNEEACRMLGYEREALLGMHLWDVDHDWPRDVRRLELCGTHPARAHTFETRHRCRSGELVDVEVTCTRVEYRGAWYALVLARDISERKRAELRRLESESRYREIFNSVSDGVYLLEVTDDGRFRHLEVNPAFERQTGLAAAALIGRFVDEAVAPAVAEAVCAKHRRCVEAGTLVEEEIALDLPAGRRIFHSTVTPVRDERGRVYRIIGT